MIRDLLARAHPGRAAVRVAVVTRPPYDDEDVNLHAKHLENNGFVEIVASVRVSIHSAHEAVQATSGVFAAGSVRPSGSEDSVLRLYTAWDEWRNREPMPAAATSGYPASARPTGPILELHLPGAHAALQSIAAELRARGVDVIIAPGPFIMESPPRTGTAIPSCVISWTGGRSAKPG
jgi:hypothetical protein